jgi:hypothetical protein
MSQSSWTVPLKSFDAQTLSTSGQVQGTTIDLRDVFTDIAAQVTVTFGASDAWGIGLFASLDGVSFYQAATPFVNGTAWRQDSGQGFSGSVAAIGVVSLSPARFVKAWGNCSAGAPVVTLLVSAR